MQLPYSHNSKAFSVRLTIPCLFLYLWPMQKETLVYGLRAVMEAVQADQELDKVFMQKGLQGPLFKQLEGVLRQKRIPVSYVPYEKLNKLTRQNHQGVVAMISPITYQPLESTIDSLVASEGQPLVLLLDGISDVRNLGAILRTAECTGVHAVILPAKGSAAIHADTIKTSAGAIFNLPIIRVSHLKDAIYYLQASGIPVFGASEKAKESIYDAPFTQPTAILMGSEGHGISAGLQRLLDSQLSIPMKGATGSLNVSVATGVVLYEVLRQRSAPSD